MTSSVVASGANALYQIGNFAYIAGSIVFVVAILVAVVHMIRNSASEELNSLEPPSVRTPDERAEPSEPVSQ